MKPRLLRAPLTREDRMIWLRLHLPINRPRAAQLLLDMYQDAECRDADRMLQLAQAWVAGAPLWNLHYPGVIHAAWAYVGVPGSLIDP